MNRNLLRTCSLAVRWSARHLDCNTVQCCTVRWPIVVRCVSTSSVRHHFFESRDEDQEEKEKRLIVHQGEYFDQVAKQERNRQTFYKAVKLYLKHNPIYRRGHVEFLYAALDRLQEFDAHRDLTTYKQLMTLFPENKMVAQGPWDVEWMYYPKQQQCAMDIMEVMETNGVVPDDDMGDQLVRIFGKESHAVRRYQRMMYWMPKFKFANPYYVPYVLPNDDIELAKLALNRMSVDLENTLTVYHTEELETSTEDTFIVSSQSPVQSELIAKHPVDKPVFVEGGFTVWLRTKSLTYFVLQADCTEKYLEYKNRPNDDSEMFNWSLFEEEKPKALEVPPSVHEQEDGTILAMCITGTLTKESLTSWIRFLERSNEKLSQIPVVFRLRSSPQSEIDVYSDRLTAEDRAQ